MWNYNSEINKDKGYKMRVNSLVRFHEWFKDFCTDSNLMPAEAGFYSNEVFVYLGEVVNMPGHVIVAGRDGNIYFGYHDEDFEEVPEDET